MAGWYLDNNGGRNALVNGTGQSAYDVHISRQGRMVVGGQRDWAFHEQEVVDGGIIPVRYARAQGANQDPPYFRVEYSASPGSDEARIIEDIDAP